MTRVVTYEVWDAAHGWCLGKFADEAEAGVFLSILGEDLQVLNQLECRVKDTQDTVQVLFGPAILQWLRDLYPSVVTSIPYATHHEA